MSITIDTGPFVLQLIGSLAAVAALALAAYNLGHRKGLVEGLEFQQEQRRQAAKP